MFSARKRKAPPVSVDAKQMIALEEELHAVKQEYSIPDKPSWWVRLGDRLAAALDRKPVAVSRKRYIRLALTCGWFCGSHRFYTRQPILGILYLLFFWTGIPFTMTLIDLMIVIPKEADAAGLVEL